MRHAMPDDDSYFEDRLAQMEQLQDLQRKTAMGAHVQIDLESNGPLAQYLAWRKEAAGRAIGALVACDPNNAAEIASLQVIVREYLSVKNWIAETMSDSDAADKAIREEYGPSHDDQDRSER